MTAFDARGWVERRFARCAPDTFDPFGHRQLPGALAGEITTTSFHVPLAGGDGTAVLSVPVNGPVGGIVMLLHGMGDDAVYPHWHWFTALAREGLAVFSVDWDGHGAGATSRLRFGDVPAGLARLFVRLSSPGDDADRAASRGVRFVLGGHSMGGTMALHALAMLPDDVCDAAAVMSPALQVATGIGGAGELIGYLNPMSWRRDLWAARHDYGMRGLVPAFGPFGRRQFPVRLAEAGHYVRQLEHFVTTTDHAAAFGAVTTPVVWYHGERDRLVSSEAVAPIMANLPVVVRRLVPRRGHLGMVMSARVAAEFARSVSEAACAPHSRRAPGAVTTSR